MRSSITFHPKTNQKCKIWAILFWLTIWQAASMLVGRDFLLASPITAAVRFFTLLTSSDFFSSILFSASRILLGFILGLTVGSCAAIGSHMNKHISELLSPLLSVLRAIPVASYVIIALIWMPSRALSSLIVFLVVFPVIYSAVSAEISRADAKLIEAAKVFHLSPFRKALYVYALPSIPSFGKTCSIAMGLAWKSGAAAELIAIPSGSIGEKLYNAKVYLMTGDLMAWTAVIILLSALSDRLFSALLRFIAYLAERR